MTDTITDAQIIAIRDDYLPNQGEPFDCIAFARAILRAAIQSDAIASVERLTAQPVKTLQNAIEEIDILTGRHPLDVGQRHGSVTLKELQERLANIRTITGHFIHQPLPSTPEQDESP